MNMIKSPQQTKQMRNTSTNNQTMHNLVTRTPDIKPVRIPFLRNLRLSQFAITSLSTTQFSVSPTYSHSVQRTTSKIERRHQRHPVQTHSPHLRFPAKFQQAVHDGNDERETETGIHGRAVWSILWAAESWVQRCVDTASC